MSVVHAIFDKLQIEYTEQKDGEELRFRCINPKHSDSSPSADINTSTGLWLCRSCGFKGNLERLIKVVSGENVDLSQYVKPDEEFRFKVQNIFKQSLKGIGRYDDIVQFDDTMGNELKNFKPALSCGEAVKYLTGPKRKLNDQTIKDHNLYFSAEGDYKNRVIIPYFKNGKLIGFNSRYIYDGDKKFRYMYFLSHSQFEDYVYNLENVVDDTYCIIVEGPFDLMILRQLGYKNVISTLSTRVSEKHLQHIIKFKKIIFCFDDDKESKAGQKAVIKASNLILEVNPNKPLFYCKLPEGKDPTEATEAELKAAFNKLIPIRKPDKR
jgi:hypothetical protein